MAARTPSAIFSTIAGRADVLGQDGRAHGGAHGEAERVLRPGLVVAGEDGGMRREHAVAAARPDHGDLADLRLAPRAVREEDAAEGVVRQNPGKVVDPAVALRLADHGDDGVRRHAARRDELLQARGVRDRLDLDLRDVDGHVSLPCRSQAQAVRRCVTVSATTRPRLMTWVRSARLVSASSGSAASMITRSATQPGSAP